MFSVTYNIVKVYPRLSIFYNSSTKKGKCPGNIFNCPGKLLLDSVQTPGIGTVDMFLKSL